MKMRQDFLTLAFNLLNGFAGIAMNPCIRNHQIRFYIQLHRIKTDISNEFNCSITQTGLGVKPTWIHMGNCFCPIDQNFQGLIVQLFLVVVKNCSNGCDTNRRRGPHPPFFRNHGLDLATNPSLTNSKVFKRRKNCHGQGIIFK